MKKIFTNSEIVHVFAERSQEEGKTSNNGMFFKGDNIYSYGTHYILAQYLDQNTILINNTGYSSSTGKHISLITNATRQYTQYFFNEICLNNVYDIITWNDQKLKNARKKEIYAIEIISKFEAFNQFLNDKKKAVIKNRYGYDLQDKALIIKDEKFKEIKKIYKAISKDSDKYIQEAQERARKEQERAKQRYNESLVKFKNYEINYISLKSNEDFLRISQDNTKIETTQGVKIDVQEAKKLYLMIQEGKEIKGLKIGNYTIISINGTLKIGCHKININNVHEIGKQLINNF